MSHVLIAGLGDLGQSLADVLLEDGHRISGIRRRDTVFPGVDLYSQNLISDPLLLPPEQVDLLYIIMTPARRDVAAYRDAYLTAPLRLLDALAIRQPLPPMVFVSSSAVFGEGSGHVSEQSTPRPDKFNGRILLAAEQEISLRSVATVVRFSGIYGPGRDYLQRQLQAIEQGDPAPAAKWSNRIHRDDCVGILAQLGRGWLSGDMQPALVLGTDNEPAINTAVLNWLAARRQIPVTLPVPDIAPGKRLRSDYLASGAYRLRYPDFRRGYSSF